MRDLALGLTIFAALGGSFAFPYIGALSWTWFAIMNPHDEAYRIGQLLPLNLIIATAALFCWLISKEEKTWPKGLAPIFLVFFFLWTTFNAFFAFDPAWSWPYWDRTWKIFLMGLLVAATTTTKVRFHALMWVVAISLGFWGIRGGAFTLLTGGNYHVYGPEGTIIGDNNQLALAVVMILPIMNYLRLHSGSPYIRWGIVGAIVLNVLTVLGSYSRGGVLALGVLGIAFWLRAKNKIVYPIVACIILVPVLKFMPATFYDRMNTVSQYDSDDSFQDRVEAWHVAFSYARDHFPVGAGFYAPQLQALWNRYLPDSPHAAHSMYFQVLGEQGFMGLFLYISTIVVSFRNFQVTIARTRGLPEFGWANDLARMLQLSLFAFCFGGAALSMAYYDVFILWICISASLRELVGKDQPISAMALQTGTPIKATGSAMGSSHL